MTSVVTVTPVVAAVTSIVASITAVVAISSVVDAVTLVGVTPAVGTATLGIRALQRDHDRGGDRDAQ
jgi:hypothetical protein